MVNQMEKLLDVKNLKVVFNTYAGKVFAVNDVSFSISDSEVVGIVGESGSGKSVAMLSIIKLLPENGMVESGSIVFNGHDLRDFTNDQMQDIRGNSIGMIFQDPMVSLNPVLTIGNQLIEAITRHNVISKADARKRAIELIKTVGLSNPEKRIRQYPFELSGGMRQRVMIAMALSCEPRLLIADEPTTSLDVTIQAQIIDLLKDLKKRLGLSIFFITHDVGLVADICDRVIIMYGGTIVEQGKLDEIFYEPSHPYTKALLKSIPGTKISKERLASIPGQPADIVRPLHCCPFLDRCAEAMEVCALMLPEYIEHDSGHGSACWLNYKGKYEVGP
jgi:oligopeptide/dipeptide ABC transporter, ATP-binding protein, C-terminal domain